MNPYNLDSVNTLRILPNVLKKFVIFQVYLNSFGLLNKEFKKFYSCSLLKDEVDEIVRLTNEK